MRAALLLAGVVLVACGGESGVSASRDGALRDALPDQTAGDVRADVPDATLPPDAGRDGSAEAGPVSLPGPCADGTECVADGPECGLLAWPVARCICKDGGWTCNAPLPADGSWELGYKSPRLPRNEIVPGGLCAGGENFACVPANRPDTVCACNGGDWDCYTPSAEGGVDGGRSLTECPSALDSSLSAPCAAGETCFTPGCSTAVCTCESGTHWTCVGSTYFQDCSIVCTH